jgi:5,10-methylenetetrahydrofolate reductase
MPMRLAKKAAAGTRSVQTQLIYNVDRFREHMKKVVDLGLHKQVYILAGVGSFKSSRMASFMATQVAGMDVPRSPDSSLLLSSDWVETRIWRVEDGQLLYVEKSTC